MTAAEGLSAIKALLAREPSQAWRPVLVFPTAWLRDPEYRQAVVAQSAANDVFVCDTMTSPLIPLADWIAQNDESQAT